MTRIILPLMLVGTVAACGVAQADDESKYKRKLEQEFVGKISWELDFEKALEKGRAQKKLIVGYFTRSYAP